MRHTVWKWRTLLAVPAAALVLVGFSRSQAPEDFETVRKRMEQAKPAVQKKHADLLALRYDLSNRPAKDLTMSRGKAVQIGPRAKLHGGMTWKTLAALSPEEIKAKGLFPKGFLALPHPNHPEGGMLFPKFHIDEIKKQEARDLTRFDLDYDLPDHFLPELDRKSTRLNSSHG